MLSMSGFRDQAEGIKRRYQGLLLAQSRRSLWPPAMSAFEGNVLRNSPGFGCWQAAIEGVQLAAAASGAASTPWHLRLTLLERLRHALGGLWWASTNELGEPSEVLRRGGQQHLVPSAAQASQPKPVEFEDALHMRKPHLYFLALAA